MIFSLKKKLAKKKLHLYNLAHCLFDEYAFRKKYNLIFIPSASFGLFTLKHDSLSVLKKIRNIIKEEYMSNFKEAENMFKVCFGV